MKKASSLIIAVLFTVQVIAQIFVSPVTVTVGNERINGNHGIAAVGGTAYGGPEYNEARNVVRFVETLSSGESLSFDVGNANNMYVIGLSLLAAETNVYSSPVGNPAIKFGMTVGNGFSANAYESGYLVGPAQPIASGNVLQIAYVSNQIIYKISTDGGTTFAPFHTSGVVASGTFNLYFEAPPQFAGPNNIFKTGTITNQPPTVNAGNDVAVALPVTVATLTGGATDVDGSVTQLQWMKVSGPAGGFIQTANAGTTQITGLGEGTYVFRLTATDNSFATASDEVGVNVGAADPNGSTVISPTIIPFTAPEIQKRGGGSEQWHDQYYVPIPAQDNRQNLDAVYFRFSWKEIETGDNVFRWQTLSNEINKCIDNGQVFGFGIMTQSASCNWRTGVAMDEADGVQMFYPLYLHNLMQGESTNSRDFISRTGGEWVPNYNSPNFIARTRRLNDSVYAWLQRSSYNGVAYRNVINYVDIRHVGEWGEWHFNMTAPSVSDWPAGRQPTVASYKAIIDAYADAYPTFKTVINVSVYDAQQVPNTWIPAEVADYALKKKNQWGFIGWRRDQWGFVDNQATYVHLWTDQNVKTFGGKRFDSVIMDRHNFAPVIGEPPGNWNNFDEPYMKNLPHEVRLYGAHSTGNGNFWTEPMYQPEHMSEGARDSVRMASKLAGPRLQIDSAVMSTTATAGGVLNIKTYWRNTGVCPVYDVFFPKWLIKNQAGEIVITDTSKFYPKWFRVKSTATGFADQIQIPDDIPAGTYSLWLSIEDSLGYRPPLAIANEGRTEDGSYQMRSGFSIHSGTSNQSPTVVVSGSRRVQLPTDKDTLTASATDPDGTIASYAWRKVRGPAGGGGTITSPTAKTTTITGLLPGIYIYAVEVTDNGGAKAIDAHVIVMRGTNLSPVAFAGFDQWLGGGTAAANLVGTAHDLDGTISATLWTFVSGPAGSTIATPSALATAVTGLVPGDYVFRLTVADNQGAMHSDDIQVHVMTIPTPLNRVFVK